MKNCPKCNELLGIYAEKCFKCGFDFTGRSRQSENDKMWATIAMKTQEVMDIRDEKIAALRRQINDSYEYAVEIVTDNELGGTDLEVLDATLKRYASQGWRLINTFTNELGENAHFDPVKRVTINSTMDQIVLIFERRTIKHETYVDRLARSIDPYSEENAIIAEAQTMIEDIKESVRQEMLQNGHPISTDSNRNLILSVINHNSEPMTAQEIAAPLAEKMSVMDVLNYLQLMISEGTVQKEGNKYCLPGPKISLRKN